MEPPKRKFTVAEAARILDTYPSFIRLGLQQGRFPFGFAGKGEVGICNLRTEID